MTRAELIAALENLETPTRELADQVLLACGWSTNYSAEEMAEAMRTGNFTYADYDNNEYQVPFTEAMGDCCWYPPGVKRGGEWINGHLRPDPLSSIDSALTLLKGLWCIHAMEFPSVTYLPANADGGFIGARQIEVQVTSNISTAICIAALKAQESAQ